MIDFFPLYFRSGPELPLFYSDEPAQPCRSCYLTPVTGRSGGVFSIRCENAACERRPQAYGRDEQQVRGIWLLRYGVRSERGVTCIRNSHGLTGS